MRTFRDATLTSIERRVLERLVDGLRREFADDLVGVWLYGSRARGEEPGPESDVDVLVITRGGLWRDRDRVSSVTWDAAEAEGANPVFFSTHVGDPEWLEERRAIRSFYLQEVDRDKIVLAGEP